MLDKLLNPSEVKAFLAEVDKCNRIVLTCHVRPDGDAIGSTLGLAILLQRLGKETKVVVPDQPPRNLSYLPGFNDIAIYSKYDPYCTRIVNEAELIICCDFNKPSRQDHLAPLIQDAAAPKILIDHHLDPDDFALVTISYPDMSSTCELAFRIIAAAGFYTDLDKDAATCLLTGLVTDTRNFSVNCKNPDIYEVLMKLMEKGADKEEIVRRALLAQSYWSLKLQAYAIASKLEVFDAHHMALICIDKEELKEYHYQRGDSEGLVNMPLNIPGVACSFFLREDADCIKVSARSVGEYPVNKICEDLYEGGGHLQASGGEFHGLLDECRKILIDNIGNYDKYLPENIEKIDKK